MAQINAIPRPDDGPWPGQPVALVAQRLIPPVGGRRWVEILSRNELDVAPPFPELADTDVHDHDQWVLGTALSWLATREHVDRVSLNIDLGILGRTDYAVRLLSHAMRVGVRPSRVCLEVSELRPLPDEPEILRQIQRLRTAGVRFALDDHGSGYSHGYLCALGVFDTIKVDRSIVSLAADLNESAVQYLYATVRWARDLNWDVVLEGIESEKTFELAQQFSSVYCQGFHLHRPEPLAALAEECLA